MKEIIQYIVEFLISPIEELRTNGKAKLILQKIEESETLFHQKISTQTDKDKLVLFFNRQNDQLVPSNALEERIVAQKNDTKNIGSRFHHAENGNQTANITRGRRKSTQLINNLTRQKISGEALSLAKIIPKIKYTISLLIYLLHYLKVF